MNSVTHTHFQQWLETYGRASAENDPRASADLFARDAAYYETPFAQPLIGREALWDYWNTGAQNLKEKEASFEILAMNGYTGIARWQAKFTAGESGKRLALDCLFVVEFDDAGLCQTFREWWHMREV